MFPTAKWVDAQGVALAQAVKDGTTLQTVELKTHPVIRETLGPVAKPRRT